ACSIFCLAALKRAPAAFLSSGVPVGRKAESSPPLPRKRAFASSRDAASPAARNAASARETMPSRSCKEWLVRQVLLDLTGDLVESRLVGHRQVREDLAVDVD